MKDVGWDYFQISFDWGDSVTTKNIITVDDRQRGKFFNVISLERGSGPKAHEGRNNDKKAPWTTEKSSEPKQQHPWINVCNQCFCFNPEFWSSTASYIFALYRFSVSVCLPVCLSVILCLCLSVCLSVCLSLSLSLSLLSLLSPSFF